MKQLYIKMLCFVVFDLLYTSAFAQSVVMVTTTEHEAWKITEIKKTSNIAANSDIVIDNSKTLQTIDGFGGCFNELGWTSLNYLEEKDRESVMKELFSPGVGANFTICRMPVGANDFSRDWYSYDENEGDFGIILSHFAYCFFVTESITENNIGLLFLGDFTQNNFHIA